MRLNIDDVWFIRANSALTADVGWVDAVALREQGAVFACPASGRVYGVLHNDARGLAALGDAVNHAPYKVAPIAPILYTKPRNTWLANGGAIVAPVGVSELHIGAALGIVIGDVATRLTLDNALQAVAGYTVVADASVPHEVFYRPSLRLKAFDASCGIGAWVRGAAHVQDPDALIVRTYLNDELAQEYNTAIFTRGAAQLLVDVTEFMTLQQGDILMLGVAHPPVLAQVGDRVNIEIEQVGTLNHTLEGAL